MKPDKSGDSRTGVEWQSTSSGDAEVTLSSARAGANPALRVDYNFKGGGGFVVARRSFNRAMPNEFAVHFRLRGRGAVNNWELKLIDTSGLNVWRHVKEDLKFPHRWKRVTVESSDIEFAWGPDGGSITQLGFIELAIVASEGGKGTMWVAEIEVKDASPISAIGARASSEQAGFEAPKALAAGWRPVAADPRPFLEIDLGQRRRVGGLIVDWRKSAPAGGFRIRVSASGRRWRSQYTAKQSAGKRSYVYLPDTDARYLRLELNESTEGATLRLQPFEFSRSIHAFWHSIAALEPRGWHPRWLHREQSLWTPIGRSNGTHCALMNDDGMIEPEHGSYSIEPMLWINGQLFTWADVIRRQEFLQEWMPVPSVIWETAGWQLRIQAEATRSGALRARYRFENLTNQPCAARLLILVRPFQVTPPWQSIREVGGVRRIHDLARRDGAISVDSIHLIVPMTLPFQFGVIRFDEGCIASHVAMGEVPTQSTVHDSFGFAAGALRFDMRVAAKEFSESTLTCVLATMDDSISETAFDWAATLPAAPWTGNGWATEAMNALRTATAHVLVTRAGPALQPGPRRYTRSWIRDGTIMSAALLRMGRADEVREFIRWYAPHQRSDGFVPCWVDVDGPSSLVEHDSHGQLIALITDYYRFASDRPFLEECWTFVERAVGCIENLLDQSGLLPVSVSHEGYLAQPVHAFWDDFWALRGLRDAVSVARVLGQESTAQGWELLATRFASSLFAAISGTRARRNLNYIPASMEWADFDPTATANAIALLDVPPALDRALIERTFDTYLVDWRRRRSGELASSNYTPYEIRIIGAFVRLGNRDAALELLRFFLSDRRPLHWNQWPEIAWRDPMAPAHLGDLPHTWIGAEYILAVRSLFAYEREDDRTLVLGAGLASEWLDGHGVRVDNMPTLYGKLSFTLRRIDTTRLEFEIQSGVAANVVLRPPLAAALRSVIVNGTVIATVDQQDPVTVRQLPVKVIFTTFEASERPALPAVGR